MFSWPKSYDQGLKPRGKGKQIVPTCSPTRGKNEKKHYEQIIQFIHLSWTTPNPAGKTHSFKKIKDKYKHIKKSQTDKTYFIISYVSLIPSECPLHNSTWDSLFPKVPLKEFRTLVGYFKWLLSLVFSTTMWSQTFSSILLQLGNTMPDCGQNQKAAVTWLTSNKDTTPPHQDLCHRCGRNVSTVDSYTPHQRYVKSTTAYGVGVRGALSWLNVTLLVLGSSHDLRIEGSSPMRGSMNNGEPAGAFLPLSFPPLVCSHSLSLNK